MPQLDLLIVVPAFNEQHFIEGCLSSISTCLKSCSLAYEVVVVDNGSNDRTGDVARAAGAKVIRTERASVSAARNRGVAAADDSKYVAFIDADVVITPEWAAAFMQLLRENSSELLLTGCQYSIREQAGWIEKYWFKNLRDKHLNGGNIIVSRKMFELLSGFNETLKTGEDYDFCIRAQQNGARYVVNYDFRAIHLGYPRDLMHFVRREMWHGEGDFRSWSAFSRSSVAILGVGYLTLILFALLMLVAGRPVLAGLLLGMLIAGNLALTFIRFPRCGAVTILVNSIFNLIYFLARAMSFFKAMKNIGQKY